MKTLRNLLFVVCLPLLMFAKTAAAQDTSSLNGTVTDPSGAVVPNAKVTVHSNATRDDRSAITNGSGSFIVTNVLSGDYSVKVEAPGFQTITLNGVHVDPVIGRHLDIAMKLGALVTEVTVDAASNTVQTESAAVGQLVTEEQVKSIQLNGRNPEMLASLEPGVVRTTPAIAGLNFGLDQSLFIGGARNQQTVQTLDGAPMVRTRSNGTSVGTADVDSTSQVQVLTSSYPAEYGRSAGGQIRVQTKSGTSHLHGTAYEFLRNNAFNANTWSRKLPANPDYIRLKPSAFRYNQFGWNLNGPVTFPGFNKGRDKLFFLVGQEYVIYNHDDTATGTVPTALMRVGNFSELLTNNIFRAPVQLVDPNTTTPAAGSGVPYAGNIITTGLSPNGLGLLKAYPLPNTATPTYNWIDSALYKEKQRKDTVVVEWNPTEKNRVRFSLLNYNYDDYEPHYGGFNRNPRIFHRPNQIGVLHYAWTKSATLVNDIFVSAAGEHVRIDIDTSKGLYDRTQYGINYPYLYSASTKLLPLKIPTIQIANFTTLDGGPYPSHSGGMVYDIGDTVTKVLGNHTFKAGVQFEYAGENNFDQISVSATVPGATNNQNGKFTYTDTHNNVTNGLGGVQTTRAAVANSALGFFDTYGEIGQRSYTLYRGQMYEGFLQDNWRIRPNVVVEVGMRYTLATPYYALWGNQSVFSPKDYSAANAVTVNPITDAVSGGDRYNGVVIPGSAFPSSAKGHVDPAILSGFQGLFRGYSKFYSPTVKSNIQPRLGLSWQIRPMTVLRMGGGRFFQRLGITDNVFTGGNAPFQPSATVTNGQTDTPGGTSGNSFPFNYSSQAYNYPSPEAYNWNLSIDQEFHGIGVFTLGYAGRRGIHEEELLNVNQLQPGAVQANPTIKQPDALRPYKGFSNITQATNAGSSSYHSLQANLRRRLEHGFLFGLAYTWSKSMDYGSANNAVLPNTFDRQIFYGVSDFDRRHVFVGNAVWNIPYFNHSNGITQAFLGGWQLSGIYQTQTGGPLNVSTGSDYAGVGPGSGTQLFAHSAPPSMSKNFANQTGSAKWFDTSVYYQPAAGTFAPRGSRNTIYGPGFQSANAAVQKTWRTIPGHDNHSLVFRAEAFNFMNHPTPDNPNTTPTSGATNFGISRTKGGTYGADRQLQLSLRYAF